MDDFLAVLALCGPKCPNDVVRKLTADETNGRTVIFSFCCDVKLEKSRSTHHSTADGY